MNDINFDNKRFALVENSKNGEVNLDTIFEYKQAGDLVTADYRGGPVKYGKIIAHLRNEQLEMLYQCLTTENQLKAGRATADIVIQDNKKLKLLLDWQWIAGGDSSGQSEYIEI